MLLWPFVLHFSVLKRHYWAKIMDTFISIVLICKYGYFSICSVPLFFLCYIWGHIYVTSCVKSWPQILNKLPCLHWWSPKQCNSGSITHAEAIPLVSGHSWACANKMKRWTDNFIKKTQTRVLSHLYALDDLNC